MSASVNMLANEPERCQIPLVKIFFTTTGSIERYFYIDYLGENVNRLEGFALNFDQRAIYIYMNPSPPKNVLTTLLGVIFFSAVSLIRL